MIRRQIILWVIAIGLILGLSACTNPYDPVSVSLAVVSSAQGVGLQSGLPLRAVMARPWVPQSAALWERSRA